MAVSMNTSAYRADFMISDANLPQRLEQLDAEQAEMFKQIMSDIGAASVPQVKSETASSVSDEDQIALADFSVLPDDDMELARMIIKGKVKLKEIPADRLTPDLLKALAIVRKLEKLGELDDEDDEDEDKPQDPVFNPAEAAMVHQNLMITLEDQALAEIYQILEKISDNSEDRVAMLTELPADRPDETLLFPIDPEKQEDHVFEEIIESIAAEADIVSNEVKQNVDTYVPSEFIAEVKENSEAPKIAAEKPADNASVIPAPKSVEKSAEKTESESVKIFEGAVKNGEVESFKAAVPQEKTQQETPKIANNQIERVKSASEELEMLKNAKLNKTAEKQDEAKPVQTAHPLNADSPVVFARSDGSEIKVRPSEVVAQAAKLVEKAVSENKEQSEYSLVLNPEELGRITVRLVKAADGAISVTIAAENAHTQRILEQNSELMQSNLRGSGIQLESWQTVSESRQEAYAQDYNGSSKNPYYRSDNGGSEEESDENSFAEIIASM